VASVGTFVEQLDRVDLAKRCQRGAQASVDGVVAGRWRDVGIRAELDLQAAALTPAIRTWQPGLRTPQRL
jgi:hypothetical protein